MNKAQTLLLSGALTLGTVFAAHAQTAANDDGKLIAANEPVKTEITIDNKKVALEPRVREGRFTDALLLSHDHKIMVVYISGGKGTKENPEQYTAKEYGDILKKSFASTKYTDNPTDIVVVWEESGEEGVTVASVLINGEEWKTKEGDRVFTPRMIGKHIDGFADLYAQSKGVASYTPATSSEGTGLALNHDN